MAEVEQPRTRSEPSLASDLVVGLFGLLWRMIRLPVHGALVLMEPVVRLALLALGLLSVLAAILFRFAVDAPNFPFWPMLGFGLACGVFLALYEWLIRVFAR